MRTAFFIDGYNLFYGLLAGTGYKWLDLPSLLSSVARIENPAFEPISFHYFTSPVQPKLSTRGIQSKEAQDTYIRALKAKGVEVILGRHRLDPAKAPRFVDRNTPPSRQDQVDIWRLEEKETDVNIAISMYRMAAKQTVLPIEERIRHMVLVSGDTDMQPALKAIREDFPDMHIGVILPHRENIPRCVPGSLNNYAHWLRRHIKFSELQDNQFPTRVPTNKKPATKPVYW
ncbi:MULTISPECIES: NYN domain-containing protein [Nitrincola]|uniref:NYN domain protein n=1 Tax=Nitrincola nitratireducens TaxID=1229521 RepID=W9UW41_9GAMM|nr:MULTISPECIES: NYN domain-containing protein [Nitrincola]EXJ11299.1 NYN domain protein [Nitrincola nitratireducens]